MKLISLLAAALASFVIAAPASAAVVYENGSLNGSYDAKSISPDQSVSNSFTLAGALNLTGATVGLWTASGTTPTALSWSIGSTAFADDLGSGSSTLSDEYVGTNFRGYDVSLATFSLNVATGAGEYWLTLLNGVSSTGAPIYWDVSLGPSTARYRINNDEGYIDSEYFKLFGDEGTTPVPVPEPASIAVLSAGLVGLAASRRRRRIA